jgi:hypothetical protein
MVHIAKIDELYEGMHGSKGTLKQLEAFAEELQMIMDEPKEPAHHVDHEVEDDN